MDFIARKFLSLVSVANECSAVSQLLLLKPLSTVFISVRARRNVRCADFVTQVDRLAATHAIGIIDLLSIDTEGSDALVLAGATQLLQSRRVRMLEFEYHSKGGWQRPGMLHDVVNTLASFGYTCFWQGNSGRLAPLLPWCDGFEFRKWSNIVCTWQGGLVKTLRSLAV